MRHYEIVLIIHPDQSEKITLFVEQYKKNVNEFSGFTHRVEDWGRRQLSYSISKLQKAHYILMNIEICPKGINFLESEFRFNSIIIRHMIISVKKAITELSPILKLKDDKKEKNKIKNI